MSSLETKRRLLEFSRAWHEEMRFRDAEGKRIAKGVKFAHELVQRAPVLDDPCR